MNTHLAHEQLTEDINWINQVHFYKKELTVMKEQLDLLLSDASNPESVECAKCILRQLLFQQNNLHEISHIAKKNEYTFIAQLDKNSEAADRERIASRIREQSLLKLFGSSFERLSQQYQLLFRRADFSAA